MDSLIHISVGVLLPLLPAYVLFKTLPADATVEGPWKGLRIKLGGGFGGYFLLVLIVFGYLYWMNERGKNEIVEAQRLNEELQRCIGNLNRAYKVYTVKGNISADDRRSFEGEKLNDFTVVVIPTTWSISSNGWFEAQIPVRLKQDGTPDFPRIGIRHPDYSGDDVDLDDNGLIDLNQQKREISLKSRIMLRKNTAEYSAEGSQRPKEAIK